MSAQVVQFSLATALCTSTALLGYAAVTQATALPELHDCGAVYMSENAGMRTKKIESLQFTENKLSAASTISSMVGISFGAHPSDAAGITSALKACRVQLQSMN